MAQDKLADFFEWWADLHARQSLVIFIAFLSLYGFANYYNLAMLKEKEIEIDPWWPKVSILLMALFILFILTGNTNLRRCNERIKLLPSGGKDEPKKRIH